MILPTHIARRLTVGKPYFYVAFALSLLVFMSCGGSKKMVDETPVYEEPVEEPRTRPVEQPREVVIEEPEQQRLSLSFSTVYFDYDKSFLRSDAIGVLRQNADVLKDHPEVSISVEGHCDERGTVEYNLALGDQRANSVKQYMVDLGISPSRISTISYGKERPADFGKSESAYSRNRRAEFIIR